MLVKHLIRLITGNISQEIRLKIPLGVDYKRRNIARKAFFPVYLTSEGMAMPVEYHGSAHIHSYIYADGIATIEIGETEIKKGTLLDVRLV